MRSPSLGKCGEGRSRCARGGCGGLIPRPMTPPAPPGRTGGRRQRQLLSGSLRSGRGTSTTPPSVRTCWAASCGTSALAVGRTWACSRSGPPLVATRALCWAIGGRSVDNLEGWLERRSSNS
eukprot:8235620-Alexandrium_andersonii.AAC.1